MTCSEPPRRLPPQVNGFRPFVIEELRRRKNNYPTPTIAPFVRMTSCQEDSTIGYKYFSLGLHGYQGDSNAFDITYGDEREIVGYAHQTLTSNLHTLIDASQLTYRPVEQSGLSPKALDQFIPSQIAQINSLGKSQQSQQGITKTPAAGAHPIPGILAVNVSRYAMGAGMTIKVDWKCYNRQQLEFLRHHFMTVGSYIVVEWGNNFSDYTPQTILDFSDRNNIDTVLADAVLQGRKYIMPNYVCPNNGNYDFIVGEIANIGIQFDSKTNTYVCSTTIHTSGEYLWGIPTSNTFIYTDNSHKGRIKSITDFFAVNGEYDLMLQDPAFNESGDVCQVSTQYSEQYAETARELGETPTNATDRIFVSWKFFAKEVIRRLLGMMSTGEPDATEMVRKSLLEFVQFYEASNSDDPDKKLYIGNNEYLRSTDPNVMVVLQTDMKKVISDKWRPAGFKNFDEGVPKGTGLINNGIWINSGLIRAAFTEAGSLQQAVQTILSAMNRASAGYWNLQIYYDADEAKYRIVDLKYGQLNPEELPTLYKFNVHSMSEGISYGECLEIGFESVFPPELVTQLALITRLKNQGPNELSKQLERYPLIGTTSHFAFAMNWTNLTNPLADIIQQRRSAALPASDKKSFSQVDNSDSIPILTDSSKLLVKNAARLIADANTGPEVKTTPSTPGPGAGLDVTGLVASYGSSGGNNVEPMTINNSVAPEASRGITAIIQKAKPFESDINNAAIRHGIDPKLLTALIQHESSFNPSGDSGYAYGLTQMTLDTAQRLRPGTTIRDLNTPSISTELGARLLAQNIRFQQSKGLSGDDAVAAALSQYNAGYRPEFGYGGRANDPNITRVCNGWKKGTENIPKSLKNIDDHCIPRNIVPVIQGEYSNSAYINNIMGTWKQLSLAQSFPPQTPGVTSTTAPRPYPGIQLPQPYQGSLPGALATPTTPVTVNQLTQERLANQITEAEIERLQQKENSIIMKFGDEIRNVIELNVSEMVRQIVQDGIANHSSNIVNNFVAPFPTTAKVELKIVGLSGISIFDGFFVDKLPYIYESYGCFHIVEMTEQIDASGWITTFSGIFRLLFLDGKTTGAGRVEITW